MKVIRIHNFIQPMPHPESRQKTLAAVSSPVDAGELKESRVPYVYSYSPSFYGVQKGRSFAEKIEDDKKKVHRRLKEILDTNYTETAEEDLSAKADMIGFNYYAELKRQEDKLYQEAMALENDKTLSVKMKYDRAGAIYKQAKMLRNKFKKGIVITFKTAPSDEKIDLVLVNKLKNAIEESNFDLDKVVFDYYKKLEEINTVEELKQQFPKIKVPPKPQEVIAQKVISVLTRDFYEQLNKLYDEEKRDEMTNLINDKIKELLRLSLEKTPQKFESVYIKTALPIAHEILDYFKKTKIEDRIESIPVNRKTKVPQITENDLKLLFVDYDGFILDVLKQHYLENKKLSDIEYKSEGGDIKARALKDSEYRFEKQSDKIKGVVKDALRLKVLERSYDKYDLPSLKSRLDYYSATPIGNNEKILDTIINFATCSFEAEDINQLKKLLQELDNLSDNKKTPAETIETIGKENITPIGTMRLTEEARIQKEKEIKEQRKRAAMLSKVRDEFDNAINLLYMNNLNHLANVCSGYRPNDLERETLFRAKYIRDVVKKSVSDASSKVIENKASVEASIMNWHTFNDYERNYGDSEVFKKAVAYSVKKYGKTDKNKAGQYLINCEYIKNYPECLTFARNPKVIETIMEKNKNNPDKAVEYLCEYNDYETLPAKEKSKLEFVLNMFNLKDATHKALLKNIVEKDYITADTQSQIPQGPVTYFGKSAKQQIYDKYKFPLCLDFLEAFEYAIGSFAPAEGATGIKQMGKNNKSLKYKMEVKLTGHDDRLFSSQNDYYFDIYDAVGMH